MLWTSGAQALRPRFNYNGLHRSAEYERPGKNQGKGIIGTHLGDLGAVRSEHVAVPIKRERNNPEIRHIAERTVLEERPHRAHARAVAILHGIGALRRDDIRPQRTAHDPIGVENRKLDAADGARRSHAEFAKGRNPPGEEKQGPPRAAAILTA